MCTGVELALVASAAAQAGGSMLNARQESKNQQAKINARNNAAQQEVARQKTYQDQNDAAMKQSLQNFDKAKSEQSFGDLVAAREQAYENNAPAAEQFGAISADAPQVVKDDGARKVADQLSKSKAEAKALAKIGGTVDLFQNNGLAINQGANQIGTTNTLANGSLRTNVTEQAAAANNAGNKKSMFGDLLSAAGAIGTAATGAAGGSALATRAGGVIDGGVQRAKGIWSGLGTSPAGMAYDPSTYAAAPIGAVW
jgi:hypothetical protein